MSNQSSTTEPIIAPAAGNNLVSVFQTATTTAPSNTLSVTNLLESISTGEWKELAESIANESDPEKRKLLKLKVPAVTISGTFSQRKADCLLKHSGFICIDIDNFTDRTRLLSDQYTYAVFSSISKKGLAVIVKINPDKHKESLRFLEKYYFEQYGISIDPAPSNPASLRFVSYDPELFINLKSKKSPVLDTQQKKPKSLPYIIPQSSLSDLIYKANQLGSIADDYHDYRNIAFSIASEFGESGRTYFHALASVSAKYSSNHADTQYNNALKHPDKGITIGTFYWMLQKHGVQLPSNQRTVNTIALAKKSNRTQEAITQQLVEINGLPSEQAKELVRQVYDRNDITVKSISTDPESLIENLVEWMQGNHIFKKNEITHKIEEYGRDKKIICELSIERLNTIFLRARSIFNTTSLTKELLECYIHSEHTKTYNPFKHYISQNRHRTSTGNIDRLISSIESYTPNYKTFVRKWLLALPAVIEGVPVRLVLAFLGVQLSGKTEFFRRLLPKDLMHYYGESKLTKGKDDELLMCEKLILMDDEMSGKSRQDEKQFKELTSKKYFSLRSPYGRYNEDFKRLSLLAGTSNETNILNDPTGNTRILPVEIISINHDIYNSVDKDELFMEIIREYESDPNCFQLTKEEIKSLADTSKNYEEIPFEQEVISKFFNNHQEEGGQFIQMTASDIKNEIETCSKQQIKSMKKFGTELRKLFGQPKSKKINGQTAKVYSVVKISTIMPHESLSTTESLPTHTHSSSASPYPEKDEFPF